MTDSTRVSFHLASMLLLALHILHVAVVVVNVVDQQIGSIDHDIDTYPGVFYRSSSYNRACIGHQCCCSYLQLLVLFPAASSIEWRYQTSSFDSDEKCVADRNSSVLPDVCLWYIFMTLSRGVSLGRRY